MITQLFPNVSAVPLTVSSRSDASPDNSERVGGRAGYRTLPDVHTYVSGCLIYTLA